MSRKYVIKVLHIILFSLILKVMLNELSMVRANVVQNGHSDYVIVLPDDSIPSERTAAEELADCLCQITGAKFPIVTESQYSLPARMLAIGFNKKLPHSLLPSTIGPMQPEEIIIAAHDDVLLIAGGRPRGALYGVYEYLHRLGVRWYTPEITCVPTMQNIPLPEKEYRYNPPMMSRCQAVGNKATLEWCVRNRLTSVTPWGSLPEKYGGGVSQGPDMHTFYRMISRNTLQGHPTWTAEINGKREAAITDYWGLCLSNKDVRKYLIDRTMEWARKHPENKIVWIGQNDGSGYCTCTQCREFYTAHGGQPSSLIVQLVNELADALKKEMPDKFAKTLAYDWSLSPPHHMELKDNAIVMFCPMGQYAKTIARDSDRAALRQSIADWRKLAKNLDCYLYSAPSENYWFTEPCTYSAAEDIRWAHENGITGVYAHVSGYNRSYGSDQVYMRGWVYARLAWDPALNTQLLVDDFARGYFGPAGNTVTEAIKLVHADVVDANGDLRRFNDSPVVPNHINPQAVRRANQLFEKAYSSLADPVYKKRLAMEWIAYLWTDCWLGFTGPGRYDPSTRSWSVVMKDGQIRNQYGRLAKQFMMENSIDALKEGGRKINPSHLALDKMGIAFPATRLTDNSASAIVIPRLGGKITEFRDGKSDFNPLKPYWGSLITEYPQYGSWQDGVNKGTINEYVYSKNGIDNGIALEAKAGQCVVRKEVSIVDGQLVVRLMATAQNDQSPELRSAFMLDMQDKTFGDHPSVYIEKRNGQWARRVMGTETVFWYISGDLDIQNATGRVIIASETRPEGLSFNFNPEQVNRLSFEYSSYAKWPADQGRMVWITSIANGALVSPRQPVELKLHLQILSDAMATLKAAGVESGN